MSFDPTDFRRLLATLGRSNEAAYRIGWATNEVDFRQQLVSTADIPTFVEGLVAMPVNTYFEINPSRHEGKGRSAAAEVTQLVALWADVDFKGGGMRNEAGAAQLIDELGRILGAAPAAIIYSGGGCQPYWLLADATAERYGVERISALSKRWGSLVKRLALDLGGAADGVFDLARVFRIPGTVNVKYGDPRPVTAAFADRAVSFTVEEVEAILDEWGVVEPDTGLSGVTVSPESDWNWSDEDCQFVGIAREEIASSEPTARHQWMLKWSALLFGMIRNECITEASFVELWELLVERFRWVCANTSNPREVGERELNDAYLYGRRRAEMWDQPKLSSELRFHVHKDFDAMFEQMTEPTPVPLPNTGVVLPPLPTAQAVMEPAEGSGNPGLPTAGSTAGLDVPALGGLSSLQQLKPKAIDRVQVAPRTDVGNAERLAQKFLGEFIYVPGMEWLRFDGGRYVRDDMRGHVERAKDVMLALYTTGSAADQKWALKSMSAGAISAAIKLAQSTPEMARAAEKLDADEYMLCTPGGIVNLRTSAFHKADPKVDLHTRVTAYTPDFTLTPERFLKLLEWMQPDPEIRAYLQRLAGIALIGNVDFQLFPIFVGPGANGKTTLAELLAGVLGEYAAAMPKKFLIEKPHQDHPTEIANLRGLRLGINSEVPPTAKFDEDFVKTLTGERNLTGRFMRGDFFTFTNTCLQLMTANHLPSVPGGGRGFWRRVRKLDFKAQISGEQNTRLVAEILNQEGPAILAWMVAGAADVIANGEQVPKQVLVATEQYRMEEDALARFIKAHLFYAPDATAVHRDSVYAVYRQWAFREGASVLPAQKFQRELLTQLPDAANIDESLYSNYWLGTHTEIVVPVP